MKVSQVEERKGNIRIKQVARTNIPTRLSCFNVITTIKLDDNVLFTVQCVSKKNFALNISFIPLATNILESIFHLKRGTHSSV